MGDNLNKHGDDQQFLRTSPLVRSNVTLSLFQKCNSMIGVQKLRMG